MSQDDTQCKAREGHPSLLFAHKSDIRKLSLDRPSMTAIVNNTRYKQCNGENVFFKTNIITTPRSSCAVDFHFKTGMVLWSDVREERIYKWGQINHLFSWWIWCFWDPWPQSPDKCQYCFMFVKNVDGVPSASASFARRPQSTIYLKTINCGGRQNLINKCHRWKEWKYVKSGLAFAQQFDFYHTGRLYEWAKMGQSFKIQLEDTQKACID